MSIFSCSLTFLEGILTFISPCLLPMLPIYFVYLAGSSSAYDKTLQKNKLFINSIGFVLGFTIVFVLLGAAATSIGHLLISHKSLIRIISGIVIVFFGLNFTGLLKINILNMEKRLNADVKNLNFISSIIFGFVFGFGWTPCIGGLLGSAIALASNSKTIGEGIILLILYSIGLGIPFLISSLIFSSIKDTFKKIQHHSHTISVISGWILIIEGILVLTGSMKYFN